MKSTFLSLAVIILIFIIAMSACTSTTEPVKSESDSVAVETTSVVNNVDTSKVVKADTLK